MEYKTDVQNATGRIYGKRAHITHRHRSIMPKRITNII
jgi:hypothetical protein